MALAIRDTLHPATGKREEYFVGLSDAGLKRLLKARFIELKKEREQALRSGASGRRATRDWSDDLVLDDAGGVFLVVYSKNDQFIILFLIITFKQWHFLFTRDTPGGPKIDNDWFTQILVDVNFCVIQRR